MGLSARLRGTSLIYVFFRAQGWFTKSVLAVARTDVGTTSASLAMAAPLGTFFAPRVFMILIQSPLKKRHPKELFGSLFAFQLKYTVHMTNIIPIDSPIQSPGGGAMGTVALCIAMGVIYGGSWKQSQAGPQLMAIICKNVEVIRFWIDILCFFLLHIASKAI